MGQPILSFCSCLLPQNRALRKNVSRLGLCWALFLLSLALSYAQINTGAILGRVRDPSGAVVVNARLTLENLQTGVKVEGSVNQTGDYAFRGLPPGMYKLTVVAVGFNTFEETNIPVTVAETGSHDVQLTLGATTTTIAVTSSAVALETASSTLGTMVEERQVRDLPLNGRNFTQLLIMTAGAASPVTATRPWTSWSSRRTPART